MAMIYSCGNLGCRLKSTDLQQDKIPIDVGRNRTHNYTEDRH